MRRPDRLSPLPDSASHAEQIGFVADCPGHDQRYAIDTMRIRTELGWRPLQTFESGLEATVRWYLGSRAWWQGMAHVGVRRGLGGLAA